MIKSAIVWRMAWRNLSAQKKHTMLTLLGGSIGVMLTVAAVVFYSSFSESGMSWLRAHYGVIDWEITPAQEQVSFTSDEVGELSRRLKPNMDTYPAIVYSAPVVYDGDRAAAGKAASGMLVIGIDPDSPLLPAPVRQRITDEGVILSRPAADQLLLDEGGVIGIADSHNETQLFKVAAIAEEQGLTGYRGMRRASGTILMHPAAARRLAGLSEASFNVIFASDGPAISLNTPHFPVYFPDLPFQVNEPKQAAVTTVRHTQMSYGGTFLAASMIAVAAGLILMRELYRMLADQRRMRFGALRALGFSRRHVRRIFLSEALLLNGSATLIGTVLGSGLGYVIIELFRALYQHTLQRFAALEVPIVPVISIPQVLVAAGALFAVNALVAFSAGWSISRLSIVGVLRGRAGSDGKRRRAAAWRAGAKVALSMGIIAHLLYLLFSGDAERHLQQIGREFPLSALLVMVNWLAAPFACLYLFANGLQWLQRGMTAILQRAGVPAVPVLLAMRFPLQNRRRVFSVSCLFMLVFLAITLALSLGNMTIGQMEKEAESANLMGYPAYIPYVDESDKQQIAQLLQSNPQLRDAIRSWHLSEPYRLNIEMPGVLQQQIAFSVDVPDNSFLAGSGVTLVSRMDIYPQDEDVWKAMQDDPNGVVLHELFAMGRSDWSEDWWAYNILPQEPIKPGDELLLNIYPKSEFTPPFSENRETDILQRKVKVLGFFRGDPGLEYYHPMLVSSSFYQDYQDRGFQWPNTQNLGYALIDMDLSDLEQVQQVEEQFLLHGVHTFTAPGVDQQARAALLRHTFGIYIAFMIASVVIGVVGLAIVQMRAIRERAKQLGMLRCIGISKRHIMTIFLIEGSMIGWTGLLCGWAFGSLGGYWIYRLASAGTSPLDTEFVFHYPTGLLLGLLGILMGVTFVLNLAPAYRSLSLSPGMAVRAVD